MSLGSARGRWASLCAAVCVTLLAANPAWTLSGDDGVHVDFGPGGYVDLDMAALDGPRDHYFIVFDEPPLATYRGEFPGLASPGQRANPATGRVRLDVQGGAAQAYVSFLRQRQASHMARVEVRLGRVVPVAWSYLRAANAVLVSLSPVEAGAVRRLPGVARVERMETHALDTDLGPQLVGAPAVWDGTATPDGLGTRGEGAVIGVIDSGINFEAPSFAAVGPVTGHAHVNPLPGGALLGTCDAGGIDEGRCNSKLIGAYDFVFDFCSQATNPCGAPGEWLDEPSAEDNGGHGTHVASTAAGNIIDGPVPGSAFTVPMSGVAPHANIIAYDACYTRIADGAGLCPNAATLASVEQAIADGVVDVISYSIGGGTQPWSDIVSQGFRAAHAAGILVSASAGNSGPGAFTLGHVEPWTITVGASSHGRNFYRFALDILRGDGGSAPTDVRYGPGTGGSPLPAAGIQAPIVLSPAFAASATVANDGCTVAGDSPYTPGQFTGRVVVIRRGTCAFVEKAANAQAAGAIAVIIANNQGGTAIILPGGGPPAGIPMGGVTENDGLAIRNALLADLGPDPTEVDINGVPTLVPRPADWMASFSSRGPQPFEQLKPDITAPGSLIVAAYVPDPNATAFLSGTSMSQPHVAGAALLLRSKHPGWTPSEIKSALTVSSVGGVLKENGVTPSDPFDRGAGRLDVARATRTGLVLDVTDAEYAAADPFEGGDVAALNLPNLATWSCSGVCTFERTVTSVHHLPVNWSASLAGVSGTVTPASFLIAPGASQTLAITIDGALLAPGVFSFGAVNLSASDPGVSSATLPIAVRRGTPRMTVEPTGEVVLSLPPGGATTFSLTIANGGNPTLGWLIPEGPTSHDLLDLGQLGSGTRTQFFTSFGIGQYSAQYFRVQAPVRIDLLRANGFVNPAGGVLGGSGGLATAVSFAVYAQASDGPRPADHPEGTITPVWSFSVPVTAPAVPPGIDLSGNNIQITLADAGAPTLELEPGDYWFMAYPSLPGSGSGVSLANPLWAWRSSSAAPVGAYPVGIFPFFDAGFSGQPATGRSARIAGTADCGADWLSYDQTSGSLGFLQEDLVQVTVDAVGLGEGVYQAVVCVSSNGADPLAPLVAVPVRLTVVGEAIFKNGFESGLPPPPPPPPPPP